MTPRVASLGVLAIVLAASSCIHRPYGGEKESALVAATADHDIAKVQSLLDAGANPNAMVKYTDGLYQSAWRQVLQQLRPTHPEDAAIVRAMLKAGADPTVACGEGRALNITRMHDDEPFTIVMLNPNAEVVRALLDAGVKPQAGRSALVMAIEGGETETVHMLVEAGVSVNGDRGAATTPLIAAIERRDAKMMAYLEAHGAHERR